MFITFVDPITLKEVNEKDVRKRPDRYNFVFFDYIRAIRMNDNFWKLAEQFRNKHNISPESCDWKSLAKLLRPYPPQKSPLIEIHTKIIQEFRKYSQYIHFYNQIYTEIESVYEALATITMANFVFLIPPERTTVSAHKYEANNKEDASDQPEVDIVIRNKISKRALLSYINRNWEKIDKLLEDLPSKEKFYISDRDISIVELIDMTGTNYNQLVEDFGQGYDVDTIKVAYHRAKKKIHDLFKKSNKE